MTLADMIIDYRKRHDLSQRQFALECDVSNGYISMIEKGVNPSTGEPITPTLHRLQKIATGMHTTVDAILHEADDLDIDLSKEPSISQDDELSTGEVRIIQLLRRVPEDRLDQAYNAIESVLRLTFPEEFSVEDQ